MSSTPLRTSSFLMLAIRWVDKSSKSTCAAAGQHPAKAFVHTLHRLHAMCLQKAGLATSYLCKCSMHQPQHYMRVISLHDMQSAHALDKSRLWTNCYLRWMLVPQAYPHKILTGRRSRMPTIRQTGGMSGFTNRSESEYDPFGAGHSSTSISAALGMAVARDFKVRIQSRQSECNCPLALCAASKAVRMLDRQIKTCCAAVAVAWICFMDMIICPSITFCS